VQFRDSWGGASALRPGFCPASTPVHFSDHGSGKILVNLPSGQGDMSPPHNNLRVLQELTNLEKELHQPETRRNRKRLETLTHPDFVELGRSGTRYSCADVLKEFDSNKTLPVIRSEISRWPIWPKELSC
jgi:hypothetical protein